MGLDFSHSDAHWSYSGFNRFRKRLAACLGLNLDEMQGFGGENPWPNDVFCQHFMYHSDCDGDIQPKYCQEIADKLRDLVKHWPDDDFDKSQALMLADGLEGCADDGEAMEFC